MLFAGRTDWIWKKEKEGKYKGKNNLPDIAFYRANGLDLKNKVSTNEKYLPDVAFVGRTIGSEKEGKYKRKILAFCI